MHTCYWICFRNLRSRPLGHTQLPRSSCHHLWWLGLELSWCVLFLLDVFHVFCWWQWETMVLIDVDCIKTDHGKQDKNNSSQSWMCLLIVVDCVCLVLCLVVCLFFWLMTFDGLCWCFLILLGCRFACCSLAGKVVFKEFALKSRRIHYTPDDMQCTYPC